MGTSGQAKIVDTILHDFATGSVQPTVFAGSADSDKLALRIVRASPKRSA